jgi:hypothetical protein
MNSFKQTKICKYSSVADDRQNSASVSARIASSVSRLDQRIVRDQQGLHPRAVNHQSRLIWCRSISKHARVAFPFQEFA